MNLMNLPKIQWKLSVSPVEPPAFKWLDVHLWGRSAGRQQSAMEGDWLSQILVAGWHLIGQILVAGRHLIGQILVVISSGIGCHNDLWVRLTGSIRNSFTHIHTPMAQLMAMWGSVSWPRTLQHEAQRSWGSNHQPSDWKVTRSTTEPQPLSC